LANGANDPNNLIATIIANGMIYPGWTSVEITREYGAPVSYMKFTAAEDEADAAIYSVRPNDLAQGYLAGIKVIDGMVITRQVLADKNTHSIEVVVGSSTQNAIVGTVQCNPGQYLNQTLLQIAQAAAAKVSVNVTMTGDISGTSIPFERVSEHMGERVVDFIDRLARWRDMHLTDNSSGMLVLTRAAGGTQGAAAANLVEGQNCEITRLIENFQFAADRVGMNTQLHGNDNHWGTDASQIYSSLQVPGYVGPTRPILLLGEQPGNQQELQMRLQHAVQLINLDMLEITCTVPGWFMDNGELWISLVGDPKGGAQPVTIVSGMAFPGSGPVTLLCKAVKHKQDSTAGTTTDVTCCIPNGLGTNWIGQAAYPGSYPSALSSAITGRVAGPV
jgi:prophage tail gpP-like protein